MPSENLSQDMLVTLIIVALIAFFIGFFIARSMRGNSSSDSTMSDAQKELENYKIAVNEHFGKTADLVDNLTQSYKDVFEHLGESAKSLLTEEQLKKHLDTRADKAVTLTYVTDKDDSPKEESKESKAENIKTHSNTTTQSPEEAPPPSSEQSSDKPSDKPLADTDGLDNGGDAQTNETTADKTTADDNKSQPNDNQPEKTTQATTTANIATENNSEADSANFLDQIEERIAQSNSAPNTKGEDS